MPPTCEGIPDPHEQKPSSSAHADMTNICITKLNIAEVTVKITVFGDVTPCSLVGY
ncbi:hypothetical protein B7P43_G07190 [Cryptotermes secundus]|uniref:Uncharacterized protein n=1 Tax=Cryptotermes secundus TaxID=105785 RepID=A0A2J7PJM6_9NEOP|nr:hypothetical protein B7P43_G07190 [Cryptotermes secundus]